MDIDKEFNAKSAQRAQRDIPVTLWLEEILDAIENCIRYDISKLALQVPLGPYWLIDSEARVINDKKYKFNDDTLAELEQRGFRIETKKITYTTGMWWWKRTIYGTEITVTW